MSLACGFQTDIEAGKKTKAEWGFCRRGKAQGFGHIDGEAGESIFDLRPESTSCEFWSDIAAVLCNEFFSRSM